MLGDKTQPREKRQEALKFVVHLIGDVHQPLHCTDRNGDKGGNTRLVMYPGQREAQSLHVVWDRWLVRDFIDGRRVADVAEALQRSITPSQREQWATLYPKGWANESHAVANAAVYHRFAADGAPPTISRAYVQRSTPVVAEQLMRAGVRLAMVLNSALQ